MFRANTAFNAALQGLPYKSYTLFLLYTCVFLSIVDIKYVLIVEQSVFLYKHLVYLAFCYKLLAQLKK